MAKRTLYFLSMVLISFGLWTSSVHAGEVCGSKEGRVNEVIKFAIPDYFPPTEEIIPAMIIEQIGLEAIKACVIFGRASLRGGCSRHDNCYETCGESKGECDRKLLHDWISECKDQYANQRFPGIDNPARTACRELCTKFVTLMSETQKFNNTSGGIQLCPSCDAFEKAQKNCHPLNTFGWLQPILNLVLE